MAPQENLDRIKACYDAAKDKDADTPTKHHVDGPDAEPSRQRSIDPDTDGALPLHLRLPAELHGRRCRPAGQPDTGGGSSGCTGWPSCLVSAGSRQVVALARDLLRGTGSLV